jgi:proliferating cell nuclear antigen
MPASEFSRIVKDLASLGESVRIEVSKEGVRFASDGEGANGSVLLKQTDAARRKYAHFGKDEGASKTEEDADDDNEAAEGGDDEEEGEEGGSKKKSKKPVKTEDVEMNGDDEEDGEEEFKPKSDDEGEAEQDDEEEEESSNKKKRKKAPSKVRPSTSFFLIPCISSC